eukprot:1500779-Rhodomonas_salina.1
MVLQFLTLGGPRRGGGVRAGYEGHPLALWGTILGFSMLSPILVLPRPTCLLCKYGASFGVRGTGVAYGGTVRGTETDHGGTGCTVLRQRVVVQGA